MKAAHPRNQSRNEDLLVSFAESVGSTLGAIAAKAEAAQKALIHSEFAARLGREGKKIVRRGKKLVSGAKKTRKKVNRRRVKGAAAREAIKARNRARRVPAKVRRSTARAAATVRQSRRAPAPSKR